MTDEKVRSERRDERAAKREAKRSAAKFRSELRSPSVAVVRIVFAMVGANAATQFAIQAWMSFRFARDVWEIPTPLCVAVIVALDLFAVTYMVFTYLLRTARKRTRAYVWLVFALGVAAQLFAAELYGSFRDWSVPVRFFAALPALFLAASLHGLIIWRNHATGNPPPAPAIELPPAVPAATPVRHVATPAEAAAGRAPVTERPARPSTPPAVPAATRPRRGTGRPSTNSADRHADAVRRVVEGRPAKDVAAEVGVSRRAVELWVKAYRERQSGDPLAAASTIVNGMSDPPQVNGHAFTPGAATEAQVN